MQYVVKRGYSYVHPKTGQVSLPGTTVGEDFDPSQKWKLQAGELKPAPEGLPTQRKNMSFDEATKELTDKRDQITAARRENMSDAKKAQIADAKKVAEQVISNNMKMKKAIQPDDYKFDEMDEGEET